MSTETMAERANTRARELHLTDARLAEIIGVSRTTISFWMTGKRLPKLEQKIKLSNALDISLNWLETGQDILPDHHLPVISFENLKTFYEENLAHGKPAIGRAGRQIAELKKRQQGFLLEMLNDTMCDPSRGDIVSIPEGAEVQIDVDHEPRSGSIIMVEHNGQMKLRQWRLIEPGLHHLRVINPAYQELNFNHEGMITDIYRGTAVAFSKSLP